MKAEKQSNQLWSVAWVASGFQYTDSLWILAATPEVACRKAMRYLRSQGYVKPQIQSVKHSGTIDVF